MFQFILKNAATMVARRSSAASVRLSSVAVTQARQTRTASTAAGQPAADKIDYNFDASSYDLAKSKAKLSRKRLQKQFYDEQAWKHPNIDFKIRYTGDLSKSAKVIDNTLGLYWPEMFNYRHLQLDKADSSPVPQQFVDWGMGLGYLKPWEELALYDIAAHEMEIFGYCHTAPRRLLGLKALMMAYLWDDVYEDLMRAKDAETLAFAERYRENYTAIMTGRKPQHDHRRNQDTHPAECERVQHVEQTAKDYIEECRQYVSPSVVQRYFDYNELAFGAYLPEAEVTIRRFGDGSFVTFDEYAQIRRYSSLYQQGLYVTLDESDVEFYRKDEAIPGMSSLLCAYDNDMISFPKENRYHAPFNQVQKAQKEQGMTTLEAFINLTKVRDTLMVSFETQYPYLTPAQKNALMKNFYFVGGLVVLQMAEARMGWISVIDGEID